MPTETDDTSTDDATTEESTDDTSTDATTTGETSETDDTTDDDASDGEAKWKALSRKHERDLKAVRKERDELKAANLSDTEKAIEAAKAEGAQTASVEFARRLVAAELKAAGVPAEKIEDLDLSKFVDEDGEVDAEKVAAAGKRHGKGSGSAGDADGGPRGTSKPGQLTRADLKSMTPKQITEAKAAGRLNDVLGIK